MIPTVAKNPISVANVTFQSDRTTAKLITVCSPGFAFGPSTDSSSNTGFLLPFVILSHNFVTYSQSYDMTSYATMSCL